MLSCGFVAYSLRRVSEVTGGAEERKPTTWTGGRIGLIIGLVFVLAAVARAAGSAGVLVLVAGLVVVIALVIYWSKRKV